MRLAAHRASIVGVSAQHEITTVLVHGATYTVHCYHNVVCMVHKHHDLRCNVMTPQTHDAKWHAGKHYAASESDPNACINKGLAFAAAGMAIGQLTMWCFADPLLGASGFYILAQNTHGLAGVCLPGALPYRASNIACVHAEPSALLLLLLRLDQNQKQWYQWGWWRW